jgi:NAD(P)-dependent dehydrogenase (short-subunit alcohol dehydrogenase family)/pimeloyl-ACP methyl ester carboxylesterase
LALAEAGPEDAPTVVCVHGYPDDRSLWAQVAATLAAKYRVVTYDVRGAGESDKPGDKASYDLDRLAEDLHAVIDDVSPQRPVHLLAHDWGSIQAWHALTSGQLDGQVASYTSISGPSLDHAGAWLRGQLRPSPRAFRQAATQLLHSGYIGFFHLPGVPELAWRTGLLPRLMHRMDSTAAAPNQADARHGLKLYRQNMLPRLTRPRPRSTDVPVQVLAPTGDPFVSVPAQTQIERWVPDLRVRRIPGGHWLPRSKPDVVARCASELIDTVEGAPEPRALRRARAAGNGTGNGDFYGRLAVITGAGSGIGRATALALAKEGADLVLTDIDETSVAHTADLARQHGSLATSSTVDVSNGPAMEQFAKQVRAEHGVPDIVINNAGIGMAGAFTKTTVADWERVIDVNLWGVIHGCRVFAEAMIERGEGGRIVNVASAAAYLPSKLLPAYATTKSAVLTLSQCLRAELAADDIAVTAVCPGLIQTNITSTTRFVGLSEDEQGERRRNATALYRRRNYPPEKVAAQILRAMRRDTPIAPVTAEARAGLLLSRATPGLLRTLARADLIPG